MIIDNKKEKYKTFFELIEECTLRPSFNYVDSIKLYSWLCWNINVDIYDDDLIDKFSDLDMLIGLSVFDEQEEDNDFLFSYQEHLKEIIVSPEYLYLKSFFLSVDFDE